MAPPKADQMAYEDDLDDVVGPPADGLAPAFDPHAEEPVPEAAEAAP